MKKDFTKIVFVFDKSGSMVSIARDMIGGFNSFVDNQRLVKGMCTVTLHQFDDIYETTYNNVNISDVVKLTSDTYKPRGSTALLDAVGKTINDLGKELSDLKEKDRPEKVIIVIITDGEENASKEFTSENIKAMIQHQTEVYKWQFTFLGANQDSWSTGEALGIAGNNTLNYQSTGVNASVSSKAMWASLSNTTACFRSNVCTDMSYSDSDRDIQDKLTKKTNQDS